MHSGLLEKCYMAFLEVSYLSITEIEVLVGRAKRVVSSFLLFHVIIGEPFGPHWKQLLN